MVTKTAGEIMIPLDKYPHIPYWFTIRDAISVMLYSTLEIDGQKSLPRAVLVFNEEYKLIGFVRRRDILRGIDPDILLGAHAHHSKLLFEVELDPNLLEISYQNLVSMLKQKANLTVGSIMMPIQYTVDANDHLIKIIYEIDKTSTSMIPVVKEGEVIGVVRTVEVLKELAKLLEIE